MIAAVIGPVATLIDDVVKRAFPDKTEAARIQAQLSIALLQADFSALQAQIEVNKTEAASNSIFVAGWRPFCGWCCGSALAWTFVVEPLLGFTLASIGHPVALPALDISTLMPVLLGMLGLGGLRTYEKVNGKGTSNQ